MRLSLPSSGQLLAIGSFLIAVFRRGFAAHAGGPLGGAAGAGLGLSPKAARLVLQSPQHLFKLETAIPFLGSFHGSGLRQSLLQTFREATQILLCHAELMLEIVVDRPALQLLLELPENKCRRATLIFQVPLIARHMSAGTGSVSAPGTSRLMPPR